MKPNVAAFDVKGYTGVWGRWLLTPTPSPLFFYYGSRLDKTTSAINRMGMVR